MKKTPITISELDVQPISDEDLSEYAFGQAGSTSYCECCESSDVVRCRGDWDSQ